MNFVLHARFALLEDMLGFPLAIRGLLYEEGHLTVLFAVSQGTLSYLDLILPLPLLFLVQHFFRRHLRDVPANKEMRPVPDPFLKSYPLFILLLLFLVLFLSIALPINQPRAHPPFAFTPPFFVLSLFPPSLLAVLFYLYDFIDELIPFVILDVSVMHLL